MCDVGGVVPVGDVSLSESKQHIHRHSERGLSIINNLTLLDADEQPPHSQKKSGHFIIYHVNRMTKNMTKNAIATTRTLDIVKHVVPSAFPR